VLFKTLEKFYLPWNFSLMLILRALAGVRVAQNCPVILEIAMLPKELSAHQKVLD
jgi:hypothetical protein